MLTLTLHVFPFVNLTRLIVYLVLEETVGSLESYERGAIEISDNVRVSVRSFIDVKVV